jgi:hypothetical protein
MTDTSFPGLKMALKLYGNLLSQPSRAVFLLLKANGIPYEFKFLDMTKGMVLIIGCDNVSYINTVVTNCMAQNPSSQESFSSSQEVSRILRDPVGKY